ncbi:hypothetical protein LguiB_028957 [Lonicera macranthoides]
MEMVNTMIIVFLSSLKICLLLNCPAFGGIIPQVAATCGFSRPMTTTLLQLKVLSPSPHLNRKRTLLLRNQCMSYAFNVDKEVERLAVLPG